MQTINSLAPYLLAGLGLWIQKYLQISSAQFKFWLTVSMFSLGFFLGAMTLKKQNKKSIQVLGIVLNGCLIGVTFMIEMMAEVTHQN